MDWVCLESGSPKHGDGWSMQGGYKRSKRTRTRDTTLCGTIMNGSCTSPDTWSSVPRKVFQWSTPSMWRMVSELARSWRRLWQKVGTSFLWSRHTWAFLALAWSMALWTGENSTFWWVVIHFPGESSCFFLVYTPMINRKDSSPSFPSGPLSPFGVIIRQDAGLLG